MSAISDSLKSLRTGLRESPTAITPGIQPTGADVSKSKKLATAEAKAESEAAKEMSERWTAPKSEKEPHKPSAIQNVIDTLSLPMRAGLGIAKKVTGTGTGGNVFEEIESSVRNPQGTYGDILRKKGASNLVAAPLGFALDVALDPVNWVSAGTTAFVPRVFKGALSGGAEGAAVAAKSGLRQKGDAILRMLSKKYRGMSQTGGGAGWMAKFADAAKASSKQYDDIVKGGYEKVVEKTAAEGTAYSKAWSAIGKAVGPERTERLKEIFKYADEEYMPNLRAVEESANDELTRAGLAKERFSYDGEVGLSGAADRIVRNRQNLGALMREQMSELDDAVKGKVPNMAHSGDIPDTLADVAASREQTAKLAGDISIDAIARRFSNDSGLIAKINRLPEEQKEGLGALYESLKVGDDMNVGSRFVNDFDRKLVSFLAAEGKKGDALRSALKGYVTYINTWKRLAVGLSLPTWVSQIPSNLAFTSMVGVNPMRPEFMGRFFKSLKALHTGDFNKISEALGNEGMQAYMKFHPESFMETFGIDPGLLLYGEDRVQDAVNLIVGQSGNADVAAKANEFIDEFRKAKEAAAKIYRRTSTIGTEVATKAGAVEGTTQFMAQDLNFGVARQFTDKLKAKAEAGDKAASAMLTVLTRPIEAFGRGDQASKIALAATVMNEGVSEGELLRLNRWFKLQPGQVRRAATGGNYVLDAQAAVDMASRAYGNYKALPAFMRIAKNVPVVGSPFAGFSSIAATNTARALALNPDYFNRINWLMREMSGAKDPQEKEYIEENAPYLEGGEWAKLPFFQQNPVYLNAAGWLPQYSVNLLRSGDGRDVEAEYGPQIGKFIKGLNFAQDAGLMSTPEGRFLVDYLIVPSLTDGVLNSQGNVVYPEDAGLLEKLGLAASGAVSGLFPRSVGAAAAAVPVTVPEEAIPFVPSSSYQRVKMALQGKYKSGAEAFDPTENALVQGAKEFGINTQRITP